MKPHGYAANVGFALGYTAIYAWCYSAFVAYHFAYAGADLFRRDGLFLVTSFVIAVLPILCYRGVRAISSVFSVLVYLLLYVPIVITFAYASSKPLDEIVVVQLTFMLGMVLLFMADAIIVRSPVNLDAGIDLMPIVLALTLVLTAYTFIVYRGHLHFAGFDEAMYDQRFANVDLGSGFATRYLLSWLATVLVPLCLAHGLAAKDYRYVAGGTLASLLLYMGAANKITILLPFVFPIFYFGIGKRIRSFYPLTTGGLSLAIAALMAVSALRDDPVRRKLDSDQSDDYQRGAARCEVLRLLLVLPPDQLRACQWAQASAPSVSVWRSDSGPGRWSILLVSERQHQRELLGHGWYRGNGAPWGGGGEHGMCSAVRGNRHHHPSSQHPVRRDVFFAVCHDAPQPIDVFVHFYRSRLLLLAFFWSRSSVHMQHLINGT